MLIVILEKKKKNFIQAKKTKAILQANQLQLQEIFLEFTYTQEWLTEDSMRPKLQGYK